MTEIYDKLLWTKNQFNPQKDIWSNLLSTEEVEKAYMFHKSFPQYSPTPLVSLKKLAAHLNVGNIFVKDESYRFGLNSFKVLGGAYAIGRYMAETQNKDISELSYEKLTSPSFQNHYEQTTFFTATDGNHGKGIAWAAKQLHQKAVVYMPVGSSLERMNHIKAEGASVTITDMNYDECVTMTARLAEQTPNAVLMQDTAWDSYTKIPSWIMLGYGTMLKEACDQMLMNSDCLPTHVFIQAGVGSLAGAVQSYLINKFPQNPPKVIVVESASASCYFRSEKNKKYAPVNLSEEPATVMAGLSCGEASTIGWNILTNHSDTFISIPDKIAATGMRILAAPCKGDTPIISGESGVAGFAAFWEIVSNPEYKELQNTLGIDSNSNILCFSTEGNTDAANYNQIVWEGKFPYKR